MNKIDINLENRLWENFPEFEEWCDLLNDLLDRVIEEKYDGKKSFNISLLLSNDENIRKLNKIFRDKDSSTNVLSFPQYTPEEACIIDTVIKDSSVFLGDIAMSYEAIMRESEEFHMNFFDRCSHLFVHGLLHLFGMDHIEPIGESEMENLEVKILASFGLSNPYILRGE